MKRPASKRPAAPRVKKRKPSATDPWADVPSKELDSSTSLDAASKLPTCFQGFGPETFCNGGLRIGTDFSGLDTPAWALKLLNIDFKHTFGCDMERASQKLMKHLGVHTMYSDITKRPVEETPDVDLYVFTPPCQPFSKSGKRKGIACSKNGPLVMHSLDYIKHHKPAMILMEQVPDLMRGKFKVIFDMIIDILREIGYHLSWQILKSSDYGTPQQRQRLYIQGTLVQVSKFPDPRPSTPPLTTFLDKLDNRQWRPLPDEDIDGKLRLNNVRDHLEKHAKTGLNCFKTPIIITTGASKAHSSSMVDRMMTLTKTEAGRRGYWCTWKGGFLEKHELARMQGYPDKLIPWDDLGLSAHQVGKLMGNAMTLTVVMNVLPELLRASGKISQMQFLQLQKRAQGFEVMDCL